MCTCNRIIGILILHIVILSLAVSFILHSFKYEMRYEGNTKEPNLMETPYQIHIHQFSVLVSKYENVNNELIETLIKTIVHILF